MFDRSTTTAPRISLMAVAEIRDALTALELGQGPAAVAALAAIDTESWQAIEQRVSAAGSDLRAVLHAAATGAPLLPHLL